MLPDSILTLLRGLPVAVAEKLAGCPGPGWHCWEMTDGTWLGRQSYWLDGAVAASGRWLPCDPLSVLGAAGERWVVEQDRAYMLGTGQLGCVKFADAPPDCKTPAERRLWAALTVLAEVSRG